LLQPKNVFTASNILTVLVFCPKIINSSNMNIKASMLLCVY